MKTPIEELKQDLLDEVDFTPELRKFIGRINHIYLEKEKQVIIEAWQHGSIRVPKEMKHINNAEQYYNKTFNK